MKIKNLHLALIIFTIFYFQFSAFNTQAQASFSPVVTFAAGPGPYSVYSTDFNGDGKNDLAVPNIFNSNLSILLGDGAGGLGTPINIPVGINPRSITGGDFNGDGKADMAVAIFNDNNLSVFLGDGIGGFGYATNFGTGVGSGPLSIISVDFNGDDKADLAVSMLSGYVAVLLGNGIGSFGIPTNFVVGNNPNSLISKDLNGDGKADIATANQGSNSVSVLLGDGAGGFSAANFAMPGTPTSITGNDFNGDGIIDLATANQSSNKVSILLGTGTGSFSNPTSFSVGNAPVSINCADFNADGKADLAVCNHTSNDVSILLGNGAGGFGIATSFAVGANPKFVTSLDFNGDGAEDIATADYSDDNVSILLNNYLPASAPICLVTVDPTLTHNVVVWEKTNLDLTAIDSFIVYREVTTNNYQRIGAVSHNSLSSFDDFEANPAATAYRYKLKNKNFQGVTSLFSDYHNTIYLTHAGADFSWTPYQIENNITPVSAYKVYRDDNASGNFHSIGSTTGNQLGFTDVNYASYPNASYYVEAVMVNGACQPTRSGFAASRSNVKYRGISGVQQLNNQTAINIYPNPVGNTLNITGIRGKTTLRVYDEVGKIVLQKELENDATISTRLLVEGIYTILTEGKNGRSFNKIVVSR